MNRLANVLIAGTETPRADRLRSLLKENNCNASLVEQPEDVIASAREDHPDLVVIDLAADAEPGLALAKAVRDEAEIACVPIVVLAEQATPALYSSALKAGIEDVFTGDLQSDALFFRLLPLLRLSTQIAEMRRRRMATRRFGADIPARPNLALDEAPFSILAVSAKGGDAADAVTAALGGKARLSRSDSLVSAREMLFDGQFDAAVVGLDGEDDITRAFDFCDEVRNNPRLFNLPIVLLPGGGVAVDPVRALQAGASRVLMEKEVETALGYVLTSFGNRQRRRWRISDAIRETRTESTLDPATGIYSEDFLRAHLEALVGDAHAGARHVSLLSLAFPDALEIMEAEFGRKAAGNLVKSVAQWISHLVRLEDLVAFGGGSEFRVVLPDTSIGVAEAVMHRVAGILDFTDFAVDDVFRPIKISVMMGAAQLESGDDAAALIARAHDNLR